ncbi:MAG: DNA replication/repair protein RecF [Pyrinomonadaceae bacterium]|nr:DNA replication/repair protein RecF [Pyrinomonadaceae bacterium]MCX7640099.1 DNA replication/repair protein RecF [Pyrinomonadaceae bacterium]MDW8304271.1 DNA replication/repair protein RecF [Acidobacteriota bacterium]
MHLVSIEVSNFRNLKGVFCFEQGLNIIFGENGQGKTNCIEAIYFLATTRSFRTTNLSEMIAFGENFLSVSGKVVVSKEIQKEIEVRLEGKRKSFLVNGKKVKVNEYLENLDAVIFNANELEIVRGSPEARRNFLDSGITAIYPAYLRTLLDYNRCLKQKNALLEEAQKHDTAFDKVATMIEPWNEQIVSLASRIHKLRVRYVERLSKALQNQFFNNEFIKIRYVSSLEGKGDLSNYSSTLRERLSLRLGAEIAAGHSLVGVHRDDLEITVNDRDLKKFGSSGQQRSALLLLLIAKIEVYRQQNGYYPLFLIDDIDSELDYERISKLLELLEGKTQTFVTTSKTSFLDKFASKGKIITLKRGEVFSQSLTK